jgi:L-ascorbate metabolism protein UlaG (beta-lactamase superfamily)
MKKLLKRTVQSISTILLLFILSYIGYVYNPKKVLDIKKSLDSTSLQDISSISGERKELLFSFDNFVLESSTKSSKKLVQLIYSNPYKLNRLVLRDIKNEVENYSGDNLKTWYVYNMGTISKYDDTVICFDLSTVVASSELLDLSTVCDYLLLSHGDGDHFSPRIVKNVLENEGRVIIQEETGVFEQSIKVLVGEELWANIYNLENRKSYEFGEIEILAIKTMHRMEREKDNSWLKVNLGEYNIVHTGDGVLDDYRDSEFLGDIDLLLANVIVVPLNLEDLNARYVIPLHMHELGHDRKFLEENSFRPYLDTLDNYEGEIVSKIYPLLWGESIEIE